jgi:hypothetical protein
MTSLPPTFYSDPVRSLLAVDPDDTEYLAPDRLASEAAIMTLRRDDACMGELLGRAWRSGAPEDLLGHVLGGYVAAHGLDGDEARTIHSLAHFVPARAAHGRAGIDLVNAVSTTVPALLEEALATFQGDEEPCWCPACIAEAAALN